VQKAYKALLPQCHANSNLGDAGRHTRPMSPNGLTGQISPLPLLRYP
jgi:hypothetical protein